MVVAGGRSNFVCVYAAEERLLLRKFPLTHSRDIDGVLRLLNSSRLTDTGVSMDTMDGGLDAFNAGEDADDRLARRGRGMGIASDAALPGAKRATAATARNVLRETRCRALAFAPTGRSMAIAAVEGLMLFGQDDSVLFDPVDLTADVTPQAIRAAITAGDAPKALAMALHLNDKPLVVAAAAAVGPADAYVASQAVPARLIPRLLALLAEPVRASKHLELWLTLVIAVMTTHAAYLRTHPAASAAPVRAILRAVSAHRESLARLAEDNSDMVRFLASGAAAATSIAEATDGGWQAAQQASGAAPSQSEAEAMVETAAVARLSGPERDTLERIMSGKSASESALTASFPHFGSAGWSQPATKDAAARGADDAGGAWADLPSAWTE
jgi:periodic tryptophan protein 2